MAIAAMTGLCAAQSTWAQDLAQDRAALDYPTRTVRIIVSAPPAGGPDLVARLLADRLAPRWGQAVVVENRPAPAAILAPARWRPPSRMDTPCCRRSRRR